MSQFQPDRFEGGKALTLAGLKEHYTPDELKNIPEHRERFRPYMGNVPGQVDQKTYGVCYNVKDGELDYLTAVEVADTSELPSELTYIDVPAQRYAVFVHDDHISKIQKTIEAIGKEWLPYANYEPTG